MVYYNAMNAFMALSDPTRFQIFELIAQGEKSVGEIVQHFSFTPPTISQHLKVLRHAGLVLMRVDAQRRYYAISPEGLRDLEEWTQAMTKQWESSLNTFEEIIAEEKERGYKHESNT